MRKTIELDINQRAIITDGTVPTQALAPGVHRIRGRRLGVTYFDTDTLIFEARPEVRAILPEHWFTELRLTDHQRAVIFRDGVPEAFLTTGVHRFWTVDPTVQAQVFDIRKSPPEDEATLEMIPRALILQLNVKEEQRAVVTVAGQTHAVLGPGQHRFWQVRPTQVEFFDTNALLFLARPAVLERLPKAWFTEVILEAHQRGIIFRDGEPVQFLPPGVHRYWTVDSTVQHTVLDVAEPVPQAEAIRQVIPQALLTQSLVAEHQRGLLYNQGRFEQVLNPGRYTFWNLPEQPTSIMVIDMRRRLLAITGQELMTRDKVTLRVSLSVEWAPLDPALHAHLVADPQGVLYGLAQLAVRDFVASVTLDELLQGRDAITVYLQEKVAPEAVPLGIKVTRVGVKDVILPGEMKTLLNRVIEAEQEAVAATIRRRNTAADTRAQANAAQLMADRPMFMRLKELEALTKIAQGIESIQVVVGGEGLKGIMPALKMLQQDK